MELFDVIVAGGGPGGSVASALLARIGYRVALIESTDFSQSRSGETVSPIAARALRRLGFKAVDDEKIARVCRGVVYRWSSNADEFADHEFQHLGPSVIVDRRAFDQALFQAAQKAGAQCWPLSKVRQFSHTMSHGWHLTVTTPLGDISVKSRFVIDATGRTAGTKPFPESSRIYFDRLIGISFAWLSGPTSERYLRVIAARDGWCYEVQLPSEQRLVVYFTDRDLLPRDLRAWRSRVFMALMDTESVSIPPRNAFMSVWDARTSCRRILWRDAWLPIGDAAFSIDPLSGSGIERAIIMAERASGALNQFLGTRDSTALCEFAIANSTQFDRLLEAKKAVYFSAKRPQNSKFWSRRCQKSSEALNPQSMLSHRHTRAK